MAVPLDGAHCIYLATECGECRVVDPLPPPSLSVCVCESTPHNSLELPTDGWVHTVHSLSARHGEMENPVACTYPDAISSFPPLSLSHLANSHLPSSLMIE